MFIVTEYAALRERITNALISLRGCTGWIRHLLFMSNKIRFPGVEAQLVFIVTRLCEHTGTSESSLFG